MKTIKFLLLLVVATILLPSCKEDEIETYGSSADVYYSYINGKSQPVDETVIYLRDKQDSIISIGLTITGRTVDYDREVAFELFDKDYSTASLRENGQGEIEFISGIVPAGSRYGSVNVKIYRTDKVVNAGVEGLKFKLKLLPSKDLTTNMNRMPSKLYDDKKDSDGNKLYSPLIYKIRFTTQQISVMWLSSGDWLPAINAGGGSTTDQLFRSLFGDFGQKKAKIMTKVYGKPENFLYPNVEGEDREYRNPRTYFEIMIEPWSPDGNLEQHQPISWYWMRLFNKEIKRLEALEAEDPTNPEVDDLYENPKDKSTKIKSQWPNEI